MGDRIIGESKRTEGVTRSYALPQVEEPVVIPPITKVKLRNNLNSILVVDGIYTQTKYSFSPGSVLEVDKRDAVELLRLEKKVGCCGSAAQVKKYFTLIS